MPSIKINYTSDGSRTQATLDFALVQLWSKACFRPLEPRIVASEVVPRALENQPEELTQTRRIERQLIEDTKEALEVYWEVRKDWEERGAFRDFCKHYGYDPRSNEARKEFAEYREQIDIFDNLS